MKWKFFTWNIIYIYRHTISREGV